MPETVITYIVFPFAAGFASALSVWLLSRPAAARSRAERGWNYLVAGRWQFIELAMFHIFAAMLSVVYLSEASSTASDSHLSSILTIGYLTFTVWKSNEICFTLIRWNNTRICKDGVFSRARCLEFRDLASIDVVEGGEATLRSKQGERLKLDSRLLGAAELIETCRRHIAATTATPAASPACG